MDRMYEYMYTHTHIYIYQCHHPLVSFLSTNTLGIYDARNLEKSWEDFDYEHYPFCQPSHKCPIRNKLRIAILKEIYKIEAVDCLSLSTDWKEW